MNVRIPYPRKLKCEKFEDLITFRENWTKQICYYTASYTLWQELSRHVLQSCKPDTPVKIKVPPSLALGTLSMHRAKHKALGEGGKPGCFD